MRLYRNYRAVMHGLATGMYHLVAKGAAGVKAVGVVVE